MFAIHRNGGQWPLRDNGPIWVMYPISEYEALQDPSTNAKLIWRLVRVVLK